MGTIGALGSIACAVLAWRYRWARRDCSSSQPTSGKLLCSMCRTRRPHVLFTRKQARRHDHLRKCRECIENFERAQVPPGNHRNMKQKQSVGHAAAVSAAKLPSGPPVSTQQPDAQASDSAEDPLRLARKAETVLRGRTDHVALILENCSDDLNHVAVLRTCEALGVMRVWLVHAARARSADREGSEGSRAAASRARRRLAARAAQRGFALDPLLGERRAQLYASHLDVHVFDSAVACIEASRADGRALWVTDLSQDAIPLDRDVAALAAVLPQRVAVVIGSEGAGVSQTMLSAADRRIFLPMSGFTESLNISVAAALILQRLLDAAAYGGTQGGLPKEELDALRVAWYGQLARSADQLTTFMQLAAAGGALPFKDTRRPEVHRDEQRRCGMRKASWECK